MIRMKLSGLARVRAKCLALLMAGCALVLPLAPPAHAQFPVPFPIPPITVPGFGTILLVPTSLVQPILALNSQQNVNQIGNMQIGANNFALLQVQQGNLLVPASGVP